MSEKFPNKLWMISYTWGNDRWARSDTYQEFEISVLTDIHPIEYIPRVAEFWGSGDFSNFKSIMEIPENTMEMDKIKLWETGKFTMQLHLREKIKEN